MDIRAVTAWSLLGSHDWNRRVTRFIGHYETGVYDCRMGTPRPTLMAPVLKQLAEGKTPELPFLQPLGWWHRDSRFLDSVPKSEPSYEVEIGSSGTSPPLMIVGDDGPLTRLAVRACEVRGLHYVRCGKADRRSAMRGPGQCSTPVIAAMFARRQRKAERRRPPRSWRRVSAMILLWSRA